MGMPNLANVSQCVSPGWRQTGLQKRTAHDTCRIHPAAAIRFLSIFKETDMKKYFAFAAVMVAVPLAFAQHAAPSQNGRWVTESGNLEVDVAPCDAALCGTVVKVLANKSMSAPGTEMPITDATQVVGIVILKDFKAVGDEKWKGQMFNRENGKWYSAMLSFPATDQLVVRPYIGLPLFGKTQVWRRAGAAEAAK
jgi:uncharacterized protein (DUF2147 family)